MENQLYLNLLSSEVTIKSFTTEFITPVKTYVLLSFIVIYTQLGFCQLVTNNGADLTVNSGAAILINGSFLNQLDGTIDNDGDITIVDDLTNNATTLLFTGGSGAVIMNGTALQTFGGSEDIDFHDLTFNNSSGAGLLLGTNINVSNTLLISDGDCELNGFTIDLGTSGSLSGESNTQRIYGATGAITAQRTLNAPAAVNVAGTGCEITSGANMGVTTVIRRHDIYSTVYGSSIERNFDISPTTNTGLNATLRFHYFENELNGLTEAILVSNRSTNSGTNWTDEGGTANAGADYQTTATIDAFSLWTLSHTTVLPVTWLDFEVVKLEDDVFLDWSTVYEVNNDFFTIERSLDGITFDEIGNVAGQNGIGVNSYSFIDFWEPDYSTVYYRIKQTDKDGQFDYSEIRIVSANEEVISVFPTRLQQQDNLTVTGLQVSKTYSLQIIDNLGRLAFSAEFEGSRTKLIEDISLLPGAYAYKVTSSNTVLKTGKLIVIF